MEPQSTPNTRRAAVLCWVRTVRFVAESGRRAARVRRLLGRAGVLAWARGFGDVDVLASGGAGEQQALQRRGAQDASVEVGEDGGELGGAEARRDGVEIGGGGAVADGVDEVAAVGEEGADGVEEDLDVGGRSGGGGIGRGGGYGVRYW